ncbi:uncharacterized protein LOC133784945 [Humulus lupulus]|uniref:uncharacterized protein LOC133784945 n=1 Tax=Humulus lupulus TaxID=3486 RepID=UPI002B405B41|nr:uncharacterized protein LOC133784945 [Humulus lupulus]
MAPKRFRKNAKGVFSSEVEFDATKFISKEAFKRYQDAVVKQKTMIEERGFDMEIRHGYPSIAEQIEKRHWTKFCSQPDAAIIPIVREFYANGISQFTAMATVRGVNVNFSSASINQFYGLPSIDNDEYSQIVDNLDLNEIIQFLCKPNTQWKLTETGHPIKFKREAMGVIEKA